MAGALLAAAEAVTGGFFLLMLAGGALATAAITAVTDFPVWIDAVVFGVVSLALVVGIRPAMLRRFGVPPAVPTNIAALSGKQALVLQEVGANAGQVKLDGDVWTARPLDVTEVYLPGTTVTVMEIDGATAVVWRGP
ncbi:membrane protein implicated in regulation of membrane protease activity [Rhodococcus sp. OK519]|nr:membrane protein implicated in regulation of membrane protease activity [Rhodococcus sp. OK519]